MSLTYLKDLGERVLGSFLGAVAPFFLGDAVNLWELDYRLILTLGLAAAVGALVKGLAARFVGNPDSAAMLKR